MRFGLRATFIGQGNENARVLYRFVITNKYIPLNVTRTTYGRGGQTVAFLHLSFGGVEKDRKYFQSVTARKKSQIFTI